MDEKLANRDALARPPSEMPLVHFTTRHLLLFVAGVSVVCTILVSLDGYSAAIFCLGTVLAGAHVLSTMIGSRLRAGADAVHEWELRHLAVSRPLPRLADCPRPELRPSQLQVRTACGYVLWWFVGAAMLGGALFGIGALHWIAGPTVGWPGKVIGALSAAMVVGWGALIVAGICGIARRSWHGTVGASRKLRS